MDDKNFFESKTVHFNTWSGLAISAAWPFLPEHFRHHEWAVPALTAWLTLANIGLRFVTSGAIKWKKSS